MNLSQDQVRNLLEEQGVKDPVLRVSEKSGLTLSSMLGEVPENFSVIMVDDEMKAVQANLESLIYLTRGNASVILCADIGKFGVVPTDINEVSEQIVQKAPNLVLMDFGMGLLADGKRILKSKEEIEHDEDGYADNFFRGTDIIRQVRAKGHKGLVFGFSSMNTNNKRFLNAGADATVLKQDNSLGVSGSMQEIAHHVRRLNR
jgi:CheY-like chemotaxis protein